MDTKVLITGAAGFLGTYLVEALRQKGYSIVCLVHPGDDTHHLESLEVELVRGDLTNPFDLEQVVDGVDVIYHLAGVLFHQTPESFYRVNYEGTKNIINACKAKNISLKRFLFVSSASVAGPSGEKIINEDCPCEPINDYGKSKLLAESFLMSPENIFPTTIVRPLQVYGPHGLNIIYHICRIAKKGFVFDFIKGGTSLVFIEDITRGIIQACEHPGAEGEIYYLGENRIYPVSDIMRIFAKNVRQKFIRIRLPYSLLYSLAAGVELAYKLRKRPPPLSRWLVRSYLKEFQWCFDISKAERDFGYRSETSLEEGARITVDWFKKSGYLD